MVSNVPRKRTGGGVRGEIKAQSVKSHENSRRILGSISSKVPSLLCSLTYPDVFPSDPRTWCRDLDTFLKRFFRRFPNAGVFWVREMERRKTGDVNTGALAPHFHLILWGVNAVEAGNFLPVAWFEARGKSDVRGLGNGTYVDRSRSRLAVKRYVGKYVTKRKGKECEDEYPEGTGRWWGRRGKIPFSPRKVGYATDKQRDQLVRTRRRYIKSLRGRKPKYDPVYGCKVTIVNPAVWIRYCQSIGVVFRDSDKPLPST